MRRPFKCDGIRKSEDDKYKGRRCHKILAYINDGEIELKCTNCKKITVVNQSLLRRPKSPNKEVEEK